jgi:hypothetical protein
VLYVYPSEDDAEEDSRYGGTAFLLDVRGVEPTDWGDYTNSQSLYVVTAAHVVKDRGTRVLRVNDKRGDGWEPYPVDAEKWILDEENDLAVLPVERTFLDYDVDCFPAERIITEPLFDEEGFGPGDDVVMVGRFREYGGTARNYPSVRFGNISNLPHEDIKLEHSNRPAFLVEMRSRGGFSGSPVYIFQSYLAGVPLDLSGIDETGRGIFGTLRVKSEPYLLGVDLGQFPTWLEVSTKPKEIPLERLTKKDVKTNKALAVKELSAVTVVRPGWNLVNLLTRKDVMKPRRVRQQEWERTPMAEEESEEPESTLTRGEFEETLRKVTRKVDPGTKTLKPR